MTSTFPDRWKDWLLLAAVATLGVVAAYGGSLDFGFRYDDYHMVRPWTGRDVVSVLHRTWDPTGIEPRFYRPLAALWYALRFSLFGLNAGLQHLFTLGVLSLCAVLAGAFVWRESGHRYAGAVAAGLYAVYPAFVYSQAIWLTNQMHLFASLIVLVSLLAWQRARHVGGTAWWWLIVLQMIAFGFKEDTIMLLPTLFALTLLRRWIVRDARLPPTSVLLAAAIVLLALPYWRYMALGRHLGGYGMPAFEKGWSNLSRGLDVFLQRPAKRPWQHVAGWYSLGCVAAGSAVSLFRRNWNSLYLLLCGVLIAIGFNLPFYLVAKAEQYHLVGLGCVILLAGGLDALESSWRSTTVRRSIGAAGAAAALCFLPLTRNIATDFAPCSAITLNTDDIVQGWWVVPYEVKEWLRRKPAVCSAGGQPPALTDALETATWALGREIDETGAPVHWTSDRAVVLFRRSASRANVTVRSPVASSVTPTTVVLRSDGGTLRLVLTDTGWHTQTVRFRNSIWTALQGMHRLDIDVSPTFIPDDRFRNGDTRVLGVLMRVPELSGS